MLLVMLMCNMLRQSCMTTRSRGCLPSMSVEELRDAQIQHLRSWEDAQLQQQRLASACASLAKRARLSSDPHLEMQIAGQRRALQEMNCAVDEERRHYLKISRRLDRVAGWGEVGPSTHHQLAPQTHSFPVCVCVCARARECVCRARSPSFNLIQVKARMTNVAVGNAGIVHSCGLGIVIRESCCALFAIDITIVVLSMKFYIRSAS